MSRPVILLGGGGHARVVAETVQAMGLSLLGFTDPRDTAAVLPGVERLGGDEAVLARRPEEVFLANGLGSTRSTDTRRRLFEDFAERGYAFARLTHPAAVVSPHATALGRGVQILAGAVVGPGAALDDNVLVNTRAVVEHDARVGAHSHLAPGAVICGGCRIGTGVHVGAGAVVLQGLQVGDGAIIAAGAVVTADVEPLTLTAGVPARPKRSRHER